MRGHASFRSSRSLALPLTRRAPSRLTSIGLRGIQIQATPSSSSPASNQSQYEDSTLHKSVSPDAEFEVLGAPFSLLSISLSASQNLYTRRGTLVAVSGKAENAISTLSLLEPIRRSLLGIPFLYQRITSTSPITALVSTKSALTSFAVVHLDGRLDWIVAQRNALLAWTGHSLSVKPKINTKLTLAHWGNSKVTGRGLVGLVGNGQIYQISLKTGEEYVVHPSNVVAYTQNRSPPQPYRFKSASLRFQIPTIDISAWLPDSKFLQEMAKTQTWKTLAKALFNLRTWARRSIWGDRLFLQFQGPTTILLQTRGSRISDVLTDRDVNEIADTPTGAVQTATSQEARKGNGHGSSSTPAAPLPPLEQPTKMQYVTVKSGKAEFKQP